MFIDILTFLQPDLKITPQDINNLRDFWVFAIIFGILIIIYTAIKVYGKIKDKEYSKSKESNEVSLAIRDAILETRKDIADMKSSMITLAGLMENHLRDSSETTSNLVRTTANIDKTIAILLDRGKVAKK